MYQSLIQQPHQTPWNKGKLSGQKRPLKLQEIWGIRIRLQLECHVRDLALFNLAIDSKLRACDLMDYPHLANPFKFCPLNMHELCMVIFTGRDCERYMR